MKKSKLLLIDDDMASRLLVIEALLYHKVEIVYAKNGKEAIELFKQNIFDLVITELILPDMDGFHILREIRKNSPTVPVMALTAYVAYNANNQCIHEGFNCFMAKPITVKVFISEVETYLNNKYSLAVRLN